MRKNSDVIGVANVPALDGGLRQLEQLTAYEAQRRGLQPLGEPKLFERSGRIHTSPMDLFLFERDDFNLGPGKKIFPIPDDATAYVVGEDSNNLRSMRNDYRAREFSYIPVQFYKVP